MHPSDVLALPEVKSLARLKRQVGEKRVQALIKIQLIHLNDLLGLSHPLSEQQIDYIASEALALHYTLSIEDIHVICRRALNGHYGELYDRLTPAKALGWFSSYFEERCQAAADQSEQEHLSLKDSRPPGGLLTGQQMDAEQAFQTFKARFAVSRKEDKKQSKKHSKKSKK